MKRPPVAAVLSALLPGLGQFYNRQWLKGGGFLCGAMALSGYVMNQVSIEALMAGDLSGAGRVLGWLILLLGFLIWSIADAYRSAQKRFSGG